MTTLDLRTRFLTENHQVFILHPGADKTFYRRFAAEARIFLDHPGLELPNDLGENDAHLIPAIAMSNAIKRWHSQGAEPRHEPSRDITSYRRARRSRGIAAHVGNVKAIFYSAQPGDLVVCPGRGYRTGVLIGEIRGRLNRRTTVTVDKYGEDALPARRVNWLLKTKQKRLYSSELIQMLQNRKAVIHLYAQELRDEIYQNVYPNYVHPLSSYSQYIAGRHSDDISEVVPALNLLMHFASMYNAADEGELDDFFDKNFLDAVQDYYEKDFIQGFTIELSSPGVFTLRGRRQALPVLVALLLTATNGDYTYAQARNIQIENTLQIEENECMVEVKDKYSSIMNSVNVDKFNELCNKNLEAKEGVGLKSHVTTLGPLD